MTKFVGKFRKNKEYNDDYNYTPKKSKNEHAEIRKLLTQYEEEEILQQMKTKEFNKAWQNS